MRMPAPWIIRVRSVIGMPGRPKTVTMPFIFSASITRWKPSMVSWGAAAGAPAGADVAGGVRVAMGFLRGASGARRLAGQGIFGRRSSGYNVKKSPRGATLIRVKIRPADAPHDPPGKPSRARDPPRGAAAQYRAAPAAARG